MTSEAVQDNGSKLLTTTGPAQAFGAEDSDDRRRAVEIKQLEILKKGFKLLSEWIPHDYVEINEQAIQLSRFEVDAMGNLAKKYMTEFFDTISTRFKGQKEKLAKLTDQEPSLDRFRGVCSVLRDMILTSVAENDLAFIYSDTWRQGWKILKVPPKKQNPAQGIQSFYYDHSEQDRLVDALSEVFEAMILGGETIGYPADIENIFLKPEWIRMLGSRTGKERIWKIIFRGTEDKAIFTEMYLSRLSEMFDYLTSIMAEMHEKLPQSMWWIKVSDIFNYEFQSAVNRVLLCASYHRVSMVDLEQIMHEFYRIAMIARMIGDRDQLRHELELLNADRIEAEAILVNRDRLCAEEVTRAEVKKEEIKGKWRKITLLLKEAGIDFDFIFESEREGQHVIDVGVRSLLDANREYIGELPRYRPLFAPKISEDSGGEIAAIETKGVETEKECTLNASDIKIVDVGQSEGSISEMVRAAARDGAKEAFKETRPKKRKAITWKAAAGIYYRIIGAKRTDGTPACSNIKKLVDRLQRNCRNWLRDGYSGKGTPISLDDLASIQAWERWVEIEAKAEEKARMVSELAGRALSGQKQRRCPTV